MGKRLLLALTPLAALVAGTVSASGGAAKPAAANAKPTEAVLQAYKTKCATCHLPDGNSPLEPMNFTDAIWKHGKTEKEIVKVIVEGVPGTAMLPFKAQLSEEEILGLARYVRSFDKTAGKAAKGKK